MSVLVVSHQRDEHAEAVVREIERLGGDVAVLDLSLFPAQAQLAMRYDCCGGQRSTWTDPVNGELELSQVGAVWWRRPQLPQVSEDIRSEGHRQFAASEAHEAVAGLWNLLDADWVNQPDRDVVAHRKAYQLRVAQSVGLTIPVTVVTNDPAEARRFADARGYRNVIYKSFSATEAHWRETRLLKEEEVALLDSVQYAPVIFQEYVEAVYDLRITVVGREAFAAAIHSQQTSYPVDFRMDIASARIEAVSLPAAVTDRLLALMDRLGLVYGAIDMRLRPDGSYVFLEINPAGQWLFVEQETLQPVAAALARHLVDHDRARVPDGGRPVRPVEVG